MAQIEFLTDAVGKLFYRQDGITKELNDIDIDIITTMYGIIKNRYPKAYEAISSIYSDRLMIVRRFIACNMMNDDILQYDLNENIINVEDVKCPLKGGLCKWEGIICKSRNMYKIADEDKKLVMMIKTGLEYSEIAGFFNVKVNAIKKRILRLKRMTGARNRMELINILSL